MNRAARRALAKADPRDIAAITRGLVPWPATLANPLGPGAGWVVRSAACDDCRAYEQALGELAAEVQRHGSTNTPGEILAAHTSENASAEPAPGGRCAPCAAERAMFAALGLEPPSPSAVMGHHLARVLQRRPGAA